MKTAFLYTPEYSLYDYGTDHPMRIARLRLCYELLEAYHLFDNPDVRIIEPIPATKKEVLSFH